VLDLKALIILPIIFLLYESSLTIGVYPVHLFVEDVLIDSGSALVCGDV
jgi:hypothetical protein